MKNYETIAQRLISSYEETSHISGKINRHNLYELGYGNHATLDQQRDLP
jgi:hypothetical protein